MRERLLSVGDDYWIEDGAGNRVFLVDGKALRFRDTWILKDAGGADVAEINERKLTVRDKMTIDLGGRSAHVTKRIVGIRDHFKVDVDGERNVAIEMTLTAPGCPVAGEMPLWVQDAVAAVPGIKDVKVEIVFDPPWDQSRMSEEARLVLNMF